MILNFLTKNFYKYIIIRSYIFGARCLFIKAKPNTKEILTQKQKEFIIFMFPY